MNMKIENTAKNVETGFSRAYAINEHTVQIVNAAIAAGAVKWEGVPAMIVDIHKALASVYDLAQATDDRFDHLQATTAVVEAVAQPSGEAPAVEATSNERPADEGKVVKATRSRKPRKPKAKAELLYPNPWDAVTHEALYCLIDGVPKKELKRYLRTKHGLTWDQYREKFNLPADYPHVCKAASDRWSAVAKRQGLGRTVPKVPKELREAQAAIVDETANFDASEAFDGATPKSSRVVRGRARSRTAATQGQIAA